MNPRILRTRTTVVLCAGLVFAGGVALMRQRETTALLRRECEQALVHRRAADRLQEERRRLEKLQISPDELERLRADRAALVRLRQEIARLRGHVAETREGRRSSPEEKLSPGYRPAHAWRWQGRAAPPAALETTLWAAVGGDLETLASCVALTPAAQAKAEAVLQGLGAEVGARYPSPEALVSVLLAQDVVFAGLQVVGRQESASDARLMVDLEMADGSWKTSTLAFRRFPDGWRLSVPESVIDRYAAWLKRPVQAE
jgi:hypothetical protein